jgi:hypothetical protein
MNHTSTSPDPEDQFKEEATVRAVQFVHSGMKVGLGTMQHGHLCHAPYRGIVENGRVTYANGLIPDSTFRWIDSSLFPL